MTYGVCRDIMITEKAKAWWLSHNLIGFNLCEHRSMQSFISRRVGLCLLFIFQRNGGGCMRAFVKIYRRKNKAKNRLISALLALAVLFSSAAAGTWLIAGAAETDNFTRNIEWVDEANGIAKVTVNVQAAADGNTSTGGDRLYDFETAATTPTYSTTNSLVSGGDYTLAVTADPRDSSKKVLKTISNKNDNNNISSYAKVDVDLSTSTAMTFDLYMTRAAGASGNAQGFRYGIIYNGSVYWQNRWTGGISPSSYPYSSTVSLIGKTFYRLTGEKFQTGNFDASVTLNETTIKNVTALTFKPQETNGTIYGYYLDNITLVGAGPSTTPATYTETLKGGFLYYTDSTHQPSVSGGTITATANSTAVSCSFTDSTAANTLTYYVKIPSASKPTSNGLSTITALNTASGTLKVGTDNKSWTTDNTTLSIHGTGFSVLSLSKAAAWSDGQTQSSATVTVTVKSNVWATRNAVVTDNIGSDFSFTAGSAKINGTTAPSGKFSISGSVITWNLTPAELNAGATLTYSVTRTTAEYGSYYVGDGSLKLYNAAEAHKLYTYTQETDPAYGNPQLSFVNHTPEPSFEKNFEWTNAEQHTARVTVTAQLLNNVDAGSITYTDTYDTSKFTLTGTASATAGTASVQNGNVSWNFNITTTQQTLTYYLKLKDTIIYDSSSYQQTDNVYKMTLSDNGSNAVSVTVGSGAYAKTVTILAKTVELVLNPAKVSVTKTVTGAANSGNRYSFGIYDSSDNLYGQKITDVASGQTKSVSIFKAGQFKLYELLNGNPIKSELPTQQDLIYSFSTVSTKEYYTKLWAGSTESGTEVKNDNVAVASTTVNSGSGATFNGYIRLPKFPSTAISFSSSAGTISNASAATNTSGKGTYTLTLTAAQVKQLCGSNGQGSVNIYAQINGATLTVGTATVAVKYKVTFDANGGTGAPGAQYVAHGGTFAFPAAPTKQNYTFNGWSQNSSAASGHAVGATSPAVTSDITYYATWKQNVTYYTIKFEDGSGNEYIDKRLSLAENQKIGENAPWPSDPTKAADSSYTYTFKGWYLGTDETKLYGNGLVATYTVTGAATFKAAWNATAIAQVPQPDRSFLRELHAGTEDNASVTIDIDGGIPANAERLVFFYASDSDIVTGGIKAYLMPYSSEDISSQDAAAATANSKVYNVSATSIGASTTNKTPSVSQDKLVKFDSKTNITKWSMCEIDLSDIAAADRPNYQLLRLDMSQFKASSNQNSVYFDNFGFMMNNNGGWRVIQDFNSYQALTYYNTSLDLASGTNTSTDTIITSILPDAPSYFGLSYNALVKYKHYGLVEIVDNGNSPTIVGSHVLYDWSQTTYVSATNPMPQWQQNLGTGPQYGYGATVDSVQIYTENTAEKIRQWYPQYYDAELAAYAKDGYVAIYRAANTKDVGRLFNTFDFSLARRNAYDGITFTIESLMEEKCVLALQGSNVNSNNIPYPLTIDGKTVTDYTVTPQWNGAYIPHVTRDTYNIDNLQGNEKLFYIYPGKQTYTIPFDLLDEMAGTITATTSAGTFTFQGFFYDQTSTVKDTNGVEHTLTFPTSNPAGSYRDLNFVFVRAGYRDSSYNAIKTSELKLVMSDVSLYKQSNLLTVAAPQSTGIMSAPKYTAAANRSDILNNINNVDASVPTLRASGIIRDDGEVMTVGGTKGVSLRGTANVTYPSGQSFMIYEHARLALADYSGATTAGSSKYLQIALTPLQNENEYVFASYAQITAENVYYGFKILRQNNSGTAITASNAKYKVEYLDGTTWKTIGTYTTSGGSVTINEVAKVGTKYRVTETSPPTGYAQGKCVGDTAYVHEFTLSSDMVSNNYCTLTFRSEQRTDNIVKTIKWINAQHKIAEVTLTPTLATKQQSGTAVLTAVFTDTVGSKFTLVSGSATTNNGTASISGQAITWNIANIAQTPSLTYKVKLTDAAYNAINASANLDENGTSGKIVYSGTTYTEGAANYNNPTLKVAATPLSITVNYSCDPANKAKSTIYAGLKFGTANPNIKSFAKNSSTSYSVLAAGSYTLAEYANASATTHLTSTEQMKITVHSSPDIHAFSVSSTPSVSSDGATLTATYGISGATTLNATIRESWNAFELRVYDRDGSESGSIIPHSKNGEFSFYVSEDGNTWTQASGEAVSNANGDYFRIADYYPHKYYKISNTSAPNGYQLMLSDVILQPNGATQPTGATYYVTNVVNQPLISAVPLTGGAGTAALMFIGMALIATAGALFIAMKVPKHREHS